MAAYGTSTLGAKLRSVRYGTTADGAVVGVVVFRRANSADVTTLTGAWLTHQPPTAGSIDNAPAESPTPVRRPRRPPPPTPPWAKRGRTGPGPRPGR